MTTGASELDIDAEAGTALAHERLYRLWEENHWSAKNLDFSQDAHDWQEQHTEQQRRAILWNAAMFLAGEQSVTVTLAPFLRAAPCYEDRVYLATQVADEARHHVFFERSLREVCQIGQDYHSTLQATRPQLTWGYRQVFAELERASERLRLLPDSLPHLAQGIALYHLVIEGMLAHTGQHYLRDYANRTGLFPGFKAGITMVARDEARHIAFGIQLLHRLVSGNSACKAAVVDMLNRVLPWAAGVFTPPACDWTYVSCLGSSPQEMFAFGLHSIESKLCRAGIEPVEVKALVKIGYADPPLEQAGRLIQLINGRVPGTEQAPQVNEATMDALFHQHRLYCTLDAGAPPHRCLRDPVGVRRGPTTLPGTTSRRTTAGRHGAPRLPTIDAALSCRRLDAIATGQLKQQRAVLTRRLRPSGDLRLLLQLPRILPT